MQYEQFSSQHILMHRVTERTMRYSCTGNTHFILNDSRLTPSFRFSSCLSVLNVSICKVIYVQCTKHDIYGFDWNIFTSHLYFTYFWLQKQSRQNCKFIIHGYIITCLMNSRSKYQNHWKNMLLKINYNI